MQTSVYWDPVPLWPPSVCLPDQQEKRPEEDLPVIFAPWVTGWDLSASHFWDPAPRRRERLRLFLGLWALYKALALDKRKGNFAGAPLQLQAVTLGLGKVYSCTFDQQKQASDSLSASLGKTQGCREQRYEESSCFYKVLPWLNWSPLWELAPVWRLTLACMFVFLSHKRGVCYVQYICNTFIDQ